MYLIYKLEKSNPVAHCDDIVRALDIAEANAQRLGDVIVYEDGRWGMPAAIWSKDNAGADIAVLLVAGPNYELRLELSKW